MSFTASSLVQEGLHIVGYDGVTVSSYNSHKNRVIIATYDFFTSRQYMYIYN